MEGPHERDASSGKAPATDAPPPGTVLTFGAYAAQWMAERYDLRPRTVELYWSLLRVHVLGTFGPLPLPGIAPAAVRSWHAELARRHPVTAAKAYRLVREILATAVADELLGKNPCVVRRAGQERSPERPMLSVGEVAQLAAAMPPELRLAVLLGAWCQLRRGEVIGLERRDVDLVHATLRVERAANFAPGGAVLGPPKTRAGVRTLSVPPHLVPGLGEHLRAWVGPEATAPLFTGPRGRRVRPATLQKAWHAARTELGRPELHFHDLRHAGATWLAVAGATTRELMARVGHASPEAALRYQHATGERDAVLARALSAMAAPDVAGRGAAGPGAAGPGAAGPGAAGPGEPAGPQARDAHRGDAHRGDAHRGDAHRGSG